MASLSPIFTLTSLWANSSGDKFDNLFSYYLSREQVLKFHANPKKTVCMKCRNFYPACKAFRLAKKVMNMNIDRVQQQSQLNTGQYHLLLFGANFSNHGSVLIPGDLQQILRLNFSFLCPSLREQTR